MLFQFRDRRDAGKYLAKHLRHYAHRPDVMVLGLPRGGVPVAAEIAQALGADLDVFVVRKLGAPMYEELAMGAIASGGVRVLNPEVIQQLAITPEIVDAAAATEEIELQRRERDYRGDRPPLDVRGRTVILVDDGLATGASMRAAVRSVRQLGPAKVVIAVPVGAAETCKDLEPEVDEIVCGKMPRDFRAVGAWYEDFSQTTDEEVRALLAHRVVAAHQAS